MDGTYSAFFCLFSKEIFYYFDFRAAADLKHVDLATRLVEVCTHRGQRLVRLLRRCQVRAQDLDLSRMLLAALAVVQAQVVQQDRGPFQLNMHLGQLGNQLLPRPGVRLHTEENKK